MSMMSIPAQPFDVAGLRDALPAAAANAAWAADFLTHQSAITQTHTPTQARAHAQQGQGQVQAIPASRVDLQHDRLQTSTLPMGGLQSAFLCLFFSMCFADMYFTFHFGLF